jgi:predicted membrane channel-forming protein YqfA (hemolysin III family)
MIIFSAICLLAYFGVFAFLWQWALENVKGDWGFFIPMGWLILVPAVIIQLGLWGFYD